MTDLLKWELHWGGIHSTNELYLINHNEDGSWGCTSGYWDDVQADEEGAKASCEDHFRSLIDAGKEKSDMIWNEELGLYVWREEAQDAAEKFKG